MGNNAELGMTLQSEICELFEIEPCEHARREFNSSYNADYAQEIREIIPGIFESIGAMPVECTTYMKSEKAKEALSAHNFVLSNGATLSLRTNRKGDKVAPRIVGQCGIERFNEHFSDIAGYEIMEKEEIKNIIIEKIDEMLPIFIDYFLVSDYTVWIHNEGDNWEYVVINRDQTVNMDLSRSNFSFTKGLNEWNESTTLKYKGYSIAEIQIHSNRTFKFRFIMKALIKFLEEQKINNETLGISAEKEICEMFGLEYPEHFEHRASFTLQLEMKTAIKEAFETLPSAIMHTGSEPGERGEESKCSYDFMLEGDKTLSCKANLGKKVCPPEVGQPASSTCYLYFGHLTDAEEMNERVFKEMVFEHIEEMVKIYAEHMFDSDFLLWIYKDRGVFKQQVFRYGYANEYQWDKNKFSFTKGSVEEWNESNTLKYDGISIGEFQVHHNRDCYKFRFNFANLQSVIEA